MAGARGGGVSGHGQRSSTVRSGEGEARVEVAAVPEGNSKCICSRNNSFLCEYFADVYA